MDATAYVKALDQFIVEMEQFTEPYSWELQSVLEPLCELIRIGQIELFRYETVKDEETENGDLYTYYRKETPCEEVGYVGRHLSGRGTVMIFKFYQKMGQEPWEEDELNKVKSLDTLLSIFYAKIRLTKFAESALFYDRSLHIPNMVFFQREVQKLVLQGRFQEYAVCFLNLKRFAVVNRLLGREMGTGAMIQFAAGLQQILRHKGNVCRVSGDNFVVLFQKSVMDAVTSYLAGTEVNYDNSSDESIMVKASAGICLGTEDADNVEEIIDKAYIALQSSRRHLNNVAVVYDDEIQQVHEYAGLVESVFRDAIRREEFKVIYQPRIQLNDYTMAGAEALCIWRYEGRVISSSDYIPVLEQSNNICTLDFYVLEHVCRDLRESMDLGLNVVRVSVHLSSRHLGDNKLSDKILEIVDRHQVPHQYIEIAFAETTTDVAFHDLKKIVNELHDHGIYTSVDDFGVGYSSLNLIRQVAWDVIKIDKSFLPSVSDKTSSQYLMFSHLLAMFRELGLKCIVEGVETIEQVKVLKDNKCFLAQGGFFDEPLELEEFRKRIAD